MESNDEVFQIKQELINGIKHAIVYVVAWLCSSKAAILAQSMGVPLNPDKVELWAVGAAIAGLHTLRMKAKSKFPALTWL